jgi:16S rRNA (cytidine1402-2'-O)-methyltransferase
MFGVLYIVATPIGNLEDITLRAMRILSEVDIVLAEDTRVTGKLLEFVRTKNSSSSKSQRLMSYNANAVPRLLSYNANAVPRLLSYHQHSGEAKKLEILNFLMEGKNLALVTDAGTPGISDPGNELIEYLLSYKPELNIVPIPGASAITTALSVSGFNASEFLFLGFWPKKKSGKLINLIKLSHKEVKTVIFYESPFRIIKTLNILEKEFGGDATVLVARELTKLHETLYRGTIASVLGQLKTSTIKGEIVVVLQL